MSVVEGSFQDVTAPQLDARLIGRWAFDGFETRIESARGLFHVGHAPFSISSDGQELNLPSPNPRWIYRRIQGKGLTIIGSWQWQDGEIIERRHFRSNGTYKGEWLTGNIPDSEHFGKYEVRESTIFTDEKVCLVSTSNDKKITFHHIFFPETTHFYRVAANTLSWEIINTDGSVIKYVRILE